MFSSNLFDYFCKNCLVFKSECEGILAHFLKKFSSDTDKKEAFSLLFIINKRIVFTLECCDHIMYFGF